MRGRPRKAYLVGDEPIPTMIRLKKRVRDLIPKGANLTEVMETALIALYGDPEKRRLEDLRKDAHEKEFQWHEAQLKVARAEEEQKQEEYIRKALRIEEKYPAAAFRHFLERVRTNNPGIKQITMKEEIIREKWGIEFNREKLNGDFAEFLVEYDEGMIQDEELVKRYSIRKTLPRSYWEKDIMGEIEKEVGLR